MGVVVTRGSTQQQQQQQLWWNCLLMPVVLCVCRAKARCHPQQETPQSDTVLGAAVVLGHTEHHIPAAYVMRSFVLLHSLHDCGVCCLAVCRRRARSPTSVTPLT